MGMSKEVKKNRVVKPFLEGSARVRELASVSNSGFVALASLIVVIVARIYARKGPRASRYTSLLLPYPNRRAQYLIPTPRRKKRPRQNERLFARLGQATLTATTRLRQVTLSSSEPADIEGTKMAPAGCTKETIMFPWVMLSLARYRVLMSKKVHLGGVILVFFFASELRVTHL